MIIQIPKVPRDERIGSAFNELFMVIAKTEDADENVVWDFSDTGFFHPFFIAPLSIYRKSCGKNIQIVNLPQGLESYLSLIAFESMLQAADCSSLVHELDRYSDKTYLPICEFPNSPEYVNNMQSVLTSVIRKQIRSCHPQLLTPLSYMLGEICDNILEHSHSPRGFIFSQVLRREGFINICIADQGITIMGSYQKTGKCLDKINGSEAAALMMANHGASTKDRPEHESRGFGISTTRDMLVRGLGGAFFMLSGSAFHRYDSCNGECYYDLPPSFNWDGTIVLMKIPTMIPQNFNYLNFVQQ